ncbi:MAG: hypothetical protein RL757_228, partial [Bacteroidota bacterium]
MLFFVWILGGSFFLFEMEFFPIKGRNFARIFFEKSCLRISKPYFLRRFMYKKYREIGVNFLEKLPFSIFLLSWAILNLLQAGLTDLSHDEAYYRLYALRLDWGYFDHPPMIALFVRMGLWLGGALGVRLMSVFAQVGCLFLLHEMVKNSRHSLGIGSEIAFRLAVLSIPL